MHVQDEVGQKIESREVFFNEDAVSEALQIEEVLNRAYEIRRARGGLFGYDLEDWLEAERELGGGHQGGRLPVHQPAQAESLPWDQERTSGQCSGPNH